MLTTHQAARTIDRPTAGISRRTALRGIGGGLAAFAATRALQRVDAASQRARAGAEAVPYQGLAGTWVITYQTGIESEAAPNHVVTKFRTDGAADESLVPDWDTEGGGRRSDAAGRGWWAPIETGGFVYRALAFRFDEAGFCLGETVLRVDLTVDPSGAALTGTFARREYDMAGTAIDGWEGTVEGIRAVLGSAAEDAADPVGLPPQPGQPGEPY